MIQAETSMHPQDIALTFMILGFIRKNMTNKFMLALDWNKVDQHMQKVAKSLQQKTRINLDPDRLRWTPMISSPLSLFSGSPFKIHSVETPDTPETPETAEKPTPETSKARQNLNSALKSPGRKGAKKNAITNNSPNKNDGSKKGKNRVRAARTRGASSTATTTTDDTSDEEEAEEDVSHVTPRKKRGKNNQDSINSDDEDQNNAQGTAGKKSGNKRASSRGKNSTANENNSKKDESTKNSQNSKGKKNSVVAMNDTNKRSGKQRANKISNQSGECLGMDGGTKNNINKNRKQKNLKKKHMINYHFQENSKRRKLFLNNDGDSDDDEYNYKHNDNGYEFESSATGIRTQSRYSPTGDSSTKEIFNRRCIGDLLYHKKPTSGMKKSTSPKVNIHIVYYL